MLQFEGDADLSFLPLYLQAWTTFKRCFITSARISAKQKARMSINSRCRSLHLLLLRLRRAVTFSVHLVDAFALNILLPFPLHCFFGMSSFFTPSSFRQRIVAIEVRALLLRRQNVAQNILSVTLRASEVRSQTGQADNAPKDVCFDDGAPL